tara:strand:+ start:1213 stop:1317 length:105 start_codon:yes stop_codon:yes gene_type:complete
VNKVNEQGYDITSPKEEEQKKIKQTDDGIHFLLF